MLVSASYTRLSNAIVDNGSITVSGKNNSFASNISGSGAINIQNGAAATFNGAITGSETFTITNTSKAIVNTTISGSGLFILSGSGNLEFGAADSENVTFTSGASGTLKLDHSFDGSFQRIFVRLEHKKRGRSCRPRVDTGKDEGHFFRQYLRGYAHRHKWSLGTVGVPLVFRETKLI